MKRIDGAAWRGTRGEKICLPWSGKRIDYVRGSCLTRSISSCTSIRSRWHDDETKIDERSFSGQKFRNLGIFFTVSGLSQRFKENIFKWNENKNKNKVLYMYIRNINLEKWFYLFIWVIVSMKIYFYKPSLIIITII